MPHVTREHSFSDEGRSRLGTGLRLFTPRRLIAGCGIAVWCVVSWNAVYRQDGPHPAPLFATGGDGAVRADAVIPAEEPRIVSIEQQITATEPPMPPVPPRDPGLTVVGQVQAALGQRGYDAGAVDGVFGPRTRDAILAFERDHAMAETGKATPALLARINLAGERSDKPVTVAEQPLTIQDPQMPRSRPQPVAAPAPAPAPIPRPREVAEEAGTRYVRTTEIRIEDLLTGGSPTNASVRIPAEPGLQPPEAVGDPMVRAVQAVLANLGYSPGRIDGIPGEATRNAIAQFRVDHRMTPGNTVTNDLVARLAAATGEPVLP